MSENIIQTHQSPPPPSQSPNIDTAAAIKEERPAPSPAAPVTQNSVSSANAPINGKADAQVVDYENLDDEEYEVEYEYEDEEEEQPAYRNEDETAYEVDGDTDDPIPGQHPVELDEDDEEVEYEEEDEEVEVDEAEYDRIANKIDELLTKTSSSLKPVESAAPSQPASVPVNATIEPLIPLVEQIKPAEEVTKPAVETSKPEVEVAATSTEPVQKVQEQVEQAEEQAAPVVPVAQVRKPSPPVERASTVEETVGLAPPGQLRHVHNQWNISDLHDEDSIKGDNSDNETEAELRSSLEVASSLASGGAPNLSAIVEEDGESDNSKNASPIPPEMMRPLDRFAHQSLGDAMADEDEINEIEIALEEWTDDGDNNLEELEEEDEQDEVDELMPDNLLLHANDQIEAIDVPLTPTPSPTPSSCSSSASPFSIRRPISPSSLILTRLRQMVIAGQLAPLEELLDSTPNFFIDAILKAGWTALMYASYRGYPEIVDFCLKRGSDSNYHKEFFTSLMAVGSSVAANEGQLLLCMDLLLEHGARVNAVDKFGCSPLHYAARFGRALLTKCLCEHGANINHTNRNGWSALHWAAAENHGQVVATLLDQNINVHLETKDGVTASQLAEIRKNHEIAEALQDIEGAELLQAAREDSSIASSRASDRSASPLPAAPLSPVPVPEPETVAEQQPQQQQQQPEDRSIGVLPESTRPSAIERQLSEAEIEARKDEAREIVISAIDAALARDLSKLMGGLAPGESPSGLRKRTLVLGELDEDNESGHNVALLGQLQQQNADTEGGDGGTGAHNMIVSLTLAAVIFLLLKLIFYFNSTT